MASLRAGRAHTESETLIDRLARAQQRYAEGERRIERQRRILETLRAGEHDTSRAEALLKTFGSAQAQYGSIVAEFRKQLAVKLSREA